MLSKKRIETFAKYMIDDHARDYIDRPENFNHKFENAMHVGTRMAVIYLGTLNRSMRVATKKEEEICLAAAAEHVEYLTKLRATP